jgi:hypothetical protein
MDDLLSEALGGIDDSSASKDEYQPAIAALESALDLNGLLIEALGAPENYGKIISEATSTGATAIVLIADGDVDHEALVRAYSSQAVTPVPSLLVLKEEEQCIAVEVITEGGNPFPGVGVRTIVTNRASPSSPQSDGFEQGDMFGAWNAALLRDFFSPTQADEEVTFSLSRAELDDIAPELGGFEGLLQAVQHGPPWKLSDGRALTNLALGLMRQRRHAASRPQGYIHPTRHLSYGAASDNFPPYLPVLAALVALSVEYQHGEGGFYAHAQDRLALPNSWGMNELDRVNALWRDLQKWTAETKGKFGVFKARTLGGRPVIGMLKSQSIIRASDIEKLHTLFSKLRLTPGEPMPLDRVGTVLGRIHDEHVLSRGIRDASAQEDYRSALIERLNQILLDWDGSTQSGEEEEAPTKTHRAYSRLGIALFADGNSPPWQLGWRMPSFRDDGRVTLEYGTARWHAAYDGSAYAVAKPDGSNSAHCELMTSELKLSVFFDDGFRPSERRKDLTWAASPLTVLEFSRRHRCLVELDAMPAQGATYLLVSPENRNFDHVVSLERVKLETCPGQGLPFGWRLLFLEDAATLTVDQRDQLPGVPPSASRPRAIRLIGGLRIRRAGRVAYLAHDLPMAEVDAPPGCKIRTPGLTIAETTDTAGGSSQPGFLQPSTRRTFELQVESDDRLFTLSVTSPEGRILGEAKLRLAVGGAEQTAGAIGLVPARGSLERGIAVHGMLVKGSDRGSAVPNRINVAAHRLGRVCNDLTQLPLDCPELRFLDALSQGSGRMAYGRARNILRRYLGKRSERTTTATLEALRQRGMLEIQSDTRGRWTAVGAVRPTLYALPLMVEEDPTWGVCGTPSQDYWRHLVATGADLYMSQDPETSLPVFRLRGAVRDSGPFHVTKQPPTAIATCSSSLEELRQAFASRGFETLDKRAHDREWFQPGCADWSDSTPRSDFDWVLLRYTDPDTGSHRLHSLRNGAPGHYRYRHVRNERWATWMAYDSCVRHFATMFPGIAPWPLSYQQVTRSLWVPAGMKLPLILERALVACSGGPPARARLIADQNTDADRLRARTVGGAFVGSFDRNYRDFLPPNDVRLWLEYQAVPREVVKIVANRLGCRLDEIGDLR